MSARQSPLPGHACQVFPADDVFASAGANVGDGLGLPDQVCAGDVYVVDTDAVACRLLLEPGAIDRVQTVAAESAIGAAGDAVHLVALYTLLAPGGERVEVLLLDHRTVAGGNLYVLPLSPMARRTDYTLVQVDAAPVATRLCDLVCVSFARGTLITLPSGQQRAIDALVPGDKVLTRDHGAQPIRWLGRATLRAVGAFAPVVIGKGALGNAADLIVSQHHRMFLYQRDRTVGLPTAEVLVQAKHLVDGDTVFLRDGGVVDYFSLVFERHEIIYAEGIPTESLLVSEALVQRLPGAFAAEVQARFPGLNQSQHFGSEAGRGQVARLDRVARPRSGLRHAPSP